MTLKRWDQVRPEVAQRLMAAVDDYGRKHGIASVCSEGDDLLSCLEMVRAEAEPRPEQKEVAVPKYDWSKCKRETLERLAGAFSEWDKCLEGGKCRRMLWLSKVNPALEDARAEAAPQLRTRAEVDAEKLKVAASFFSGYQSEVMCRQNWEKLCAEPLAPDPKQPGADVDVDDGTTDPDPCSCEEALALRKRLVQIKDIVQSDAVDWDGMPERIVKALDRIVGLATIK